MPNVSFMGPTDYTAEQADIDRRRKYAEALRAQSMQPLETQTAGGWAIPISPTQGLAKMLQAYVGKRGDQKATEDTKALATRKNQALVEALGGMPRTQTETQPLPYAGDDEGNAMPPAQRTVQPTMADNVQWLGKLAQIGPDAVQMGTGVLGMQQKADLATATREQTASDKAAARQQQMALLEMRLQDSRTTAQDRADLQRELVQMRIDGQKEMRSMVAGMRQPVPVTPVTIVKDGKQVVVDGRTGAVIGDAPKSKGGTLPPTAIKMQQELLDEIGTAGNITSDIGAMSQQVNSGKLQLGPVENVLSKARNAVGMSNENSQNFSAFRATLEKLRNDSLRLNKGVQTEGDAQRAWNELVANINDPKVVDRNLKRIQEINQRAAQLKTMQLDQLRQNYGMDPIDTAQYAGQPAAVGTGRPAPASNAPAGVDPKIWQHMTPEEKALWK
jgi:hypothetical protein